MNNSRYCCASAGSASANTCRQSASGTAGVAVIGVCYRPDGRHAVCSPHLSRAVPRSPAVARLCLLALPLFLLFALAPAPANDPAPSAAFAKLVDDYYAKLFDWDPVQATYAGVHDRNDKLADLSAAAVAER